MSNDAGGVVSGRNTNDNNNNNQGALDLDGKEYIQHRPQYHHHHVGVGVSSKVNSNYNNNNYYEKGEGEGEHVHNDLMLVDKPKASLSHPPRESLAKKRARELILPEQIGLSTLENQINTTGITAVEDKTQQEQYTTQTNTLRRPLEIVQEEDETEEEGHRQRRHRRRKRNRTSHATSMIPSLRQILSFLAALIVSLAMAAVMMVINRQGTIPNEGIMRQSPEDPIHKLIRECAQTGRFDATTILMSPELLERRQQLIMKLNQGNKNIIHIHQNNDKVTSCSSENQVLIWIASDDVYYQRATALMDTRRLVSRFVLGQFYIELGGPHWKNKSQRWLDYRHHHHHHHDNHHYHHQNDNDNSNSIIYTTTTGEDGTVAIDDECRSWFGVHCTSDGFVSSLTMRGNALKGTIPTTIGLLTHLQEIDLSHNQIRRSLPTSFGKLTSLRKLSISNNELSSTLPKFISQLSNLEWLQLDNNKGLTGPIDEFLETTLQTVTNLKHLVLSNNQLTGRIPESIQHLSNLIALNLDQNNLNSRIPPTVGQLSMLETLSLSLNTAIHGTLPTEMGQLTRLRNLFLHSNRLTGDATSVFTVRALQNVDLRNNHLRGTLPTEVGLLTNLASLIVNQNRLNGTIPSEIGHLSRSLSTLNLSENRFEGTLPKEMAYLTNIATSYEFRIYNRNITGPVASEICRQFQEVEFCNTNQSQCQCCVVPSTRGTITGVGCPEGQT